MMKKLTFLGARSLISMVTLILVTACGQGDIAETPTDIPRTALSSIDTQTNNNRPPVAFDDFASIEQGESLSNYPVLNNDIDKDGDKLSIAAIGLPVDGTNTVSGRAEIGPGNTLSFEPDANFSGNIRIEYIVTDGLEASDTGHFNISVIANAASAVANRAPVAQNDALTILEDAPETLIAAADNDEDPDGDAITITSATLSTNSTSEPGSIKVTNDNQLSFTPSPNYFGQAVINYTISDGELESTAQVSINIEPVNDNPIALDDEASVDQYSENSLIPVLTNDRDLESGIHITSATATFGSVAIIGGQIRYTPDAGFWGEDTIIYSIEDADGASVSARATITVNEVAQKTITLSWAPPSFRANGEQLPAEDITAYEILITNTTTGDMKEPLKVEGGSHTSTDITLTENGTYQFKMATIDSENRFSAYSTAVTTEIILNH